MYSLQSHIRCSNNPFRHKLLASGGMLMLFFIPYKRDIWAFCVLNPLIWFHATPKVTKVYCSGTADSVLTSGPTLWPPSEWTKQVFKETAAVKMMPINNGKQLQMKR